jgi:hypothetical protein
LGMEIKRRVFFMVAILMVSFPLIASGDQRVYYIDAGAGFLFYNDDIDEKTSLDHAFDGEFSFGRYFHENMALEVVAGYIHDGHEESDLRAYSLGLEAVWKYPLSQKTRLFAGGGIAYYYSEFDGFINGIRTVDDDTGPGANILAGAEFDVGSRYFGRFQCGYRFLKNLRFDHQTLDPSGFSIIMKVGFRF